MPETGPRPEMLRVVDRLLDTHLQGSPFTGRALVNLAVAMAIEYSGAGRGVLLIDEGGGPVPVLDLIEDLSPGGGERSDPDRELVRRAADTRLPAGGGGRIAAPILVGRAVRGVLYLEAKGTVLSRDQREFAEAVATRIAAILHGADLAEKVAQQTDHLETLEALGYQLSLGRLRREALERVVEAAFRATRSGGALVGILDGRGGFEELLAGGDDREALRALGPRLGERLAEAGAEEAAVSVLGRPALLEPILRQSALAGAPAVAAAPQGFVAVRRHAGTDYGEADRSFLRALAHLLAGALARHDYFRRAAEDPLTGTGSRLALELAFERLVASARRSGSPFSLLVVDIDRFKGINDSHGHLAGDRVLQEIGDILRSRLRSQDFVGRYGGDEFVLLLPDTDAEGALRIAEELRALAAGREFGERRVQVSLSGGVATFPIHGESFAELFRRADEALSSSKRAGRDRMTVAE